nr:MAG TPA: hypothetical protein [Caudoviricetes sp.]
MPKQPVSYLSHSGRSIAQNRIKNKYKTIVL